MSDTSIVVAGGSNQVAFFLLPLLAGMGHRVVAISRSARPGWLSDRSVDWHQADLAGPSLALSEPVDALVYLAPMSLLPTTLKTFDPHRLILMSSTSRFTKTDSPDPQEQGVAAQLERGELEARLWAEKAHRTATVLRPTLIYGAGMDRNLTRMVSLIRRLGFAVVAGQAKGLRQPIHAQDLARTIVSALASFQSGFQDYNLSGGTTLTYRQMVEALFRSLGREPRIVQLPLWLLTFACRLLSSVPGMNGVNPQIFSRMNQDLIFDHELAARDLNFSPRPFLPATETWLGPTEKANLS